MWPASCPAPDGSRMQPWPRAAAQRSTVSTTAGSKRTGGFSMVGRTETAQPRAWARQSGATAGRRRAITAGSGWRKSMVKSTRPGTVLGAPGSHSKRPTVKRTVSVGSAISSSSAPTIAAAAFSASRRAASGVVPACASAPVTSTVNQ